MRRQILVTFAILASLLAVTAMPVSASHGLTVASSHTTDTDFEGGSLTNMTVKGTGDSATVQAGDVDAFIDTFEDGDTTAEAPWNGWSVQSGGSFTATTTDPINGTTSGLYEVGDDDTTQEVTVSRDTNITTDLSYFVNLQNINNGPNEFRIYSGSTLLATLQYGNDAAGDTTIDFVGNNTQNDIDSYSPGASQSVEWRFNFATNNVTVVINGSSHGPFELAADVDGWDTFGMETETTSVTNVNNEIRIDNVSFGLPRETAIYISQNHTVENSEQGFVNITEITNATATVTWETNDGSGWSTLNQTSGITTVANHTFTWPVEPNDTVRVNVTVFNESGNGEPAFTMADEGVQFTASQPTVNNSSASPTGDLNTATPTLEIDVNDSDFVLAQSDQVEVTFFVDGSSVGTDTLTSNGTASHTVSSALTGGDHTWHVVANDSYGHAPGTTSQTFQISTPGNITIRDEQNASRLIDDAQVNITAYFSGQIIRRTSSDGTVDISGFPVDEPIIVRASANGYYTRTIVIEDIFQQQSVYLLNDSVAAYQVRFDLEDPTGQYPRSDTVLFVDRDINRSGSVEWRVIAGDEFGIEGVPVDLVQDERFRLRIKNLETGATATLGKYTAIQSETVVLSPKSPTFDFGDIERAYTWEARENETSQKIIVEYAEENSSKKADVKITIHERFNESNVLVDNQTFTDTSSILFDQPLTADQVNKSWSLVLYVDRGDGYMRFGPEAIGSGAQDLIPDDLDEVWRASVGVFLLLISSMAFSELNRGVGAISTALVGGVLWWIGLLGTVAIGPAVVFAIGVSVAYKYRLRGNA